jgi:hypothetical protein
MLLLYTLENEHMKIFNYSSLYILVVTDYMHVYYMNIILNDYMYIDIILKPRQE